MLRCSVAAGQRRRRRNRVALLQLSPHVGRHLQVAARITSLFDAENIYKLHSLKTLLLLHTLCPQGEGGAGHTRDLALPMTAGRI